MLGPSSRGARGQRQTRSLALEAAGVHISRSPAQMGKLMAKVFKEQGLT